MIGKLINLIFNILALPYHIIANIPRVIKILIVSIPKIVKIFAKWFVMAIKETLNLSWTLVGLVIATLTLTGSAQQVTGLATLITLGVWLLTISFRN